MFTMSGMSKIRSSVGCAILLSLCTGTAIGQVRFENASGRATAVSSGQLKKTAVPDAESQEKADKLMREIYKEKFDDATSAKAQVRLARELLGKALEMANDPPSCYVLLREAGRLAFNKARDYGLSLEVIDALDEHFDVDAFSLRIKVMKAEDANAETPFVDRCALGIQLMAEAAAKGRLDLSVQMGELTKKAAEESHDALLIAYVEDHKARLVKSSQDQKAEKDLLARANSSPADPEANLALGKLYCFDRRDWIKGLPMLALGSDVALKHLAEKELEKPLGSAGQLELGDGWWDLAQKNVTQEKAALLARAAYWYRFAGPGLSGLLQVKVEKRLAELGPDMTTAKKQGDIMASARGYGCRVGNFRPIIAMTVGGTKQSERAVTAALVWLANHQMSDGGWSLQNFDQRCRSGDKTCTGKGGVSADAGA
ncbi:MAG: hypothetical protein WCJ35_28990, partial [Planctomycetota bacterium]